MKVEKVDIGKLERYCVVCKKEWGPRLKSCCTSNSLVVIKKSGKSTKEVITYYDLDGRELSEQELSQIQERERAAGNINEGSTEPKAQSAITPKSGGIDIIEKDSSNSIIGAIRIVQIFLPVMAIILLTLAITNPGLDGSAKRTLLFKSISLSGAGISSEYTPEIQETNLILFTIYKFRLSLPKEYIYKIIPTGYELKQTYVDTTSDIKIGTITYRTGTNTVFMTYKIGTYKTIIGILSRFIVVGDN